MEFVYRDRRKFPGLVQVSGEGPCWELRAENGQAELRLKALGVMAMATLYDEEKKLEVIGWDKGMLSDLAAGKSVIFDRMDAFVGLVRLKIAVEGSDTGLKGALGVIFCETKI